MKKHSIKKIRVVGVMNGTSLDGIDYALCEFSLKNGEPVGVELRAHASKRFPRRLRETLLALAENRADIPTLARANFDLGDLYAKQLAELKESTFKPWRVSLIGIHGQTVYHESKRCTLQLGTMATVAEEFKVPVIHDFRSKNVSLGGEGAPLAPLFHHFLLKQLVPGKPAAFVNLGGIANVTWAPGTSRGQVLAFDTGPANILLDAWMQREKGKSLDAGGRISARGIFSVELLKKMIRHPYFKKRPPKSTGRELFNIKFLETFRPDLKKLSFEDQMATLAELTAFTLTDSLQRFLPGGCEKIFVSGGGAKNLDLLKRIRLYLPEQEISPSEELGWPVEAIEAGAFAYLALMRFLEKPMAIRSITGGADAVLGSVSI